MTRDPFDPPYAVGDRIRYNGPTSWARYAVAHDPTTAVWVRPGDVGTVIRNTPGSAAFPGEPYPLDGWSTVQFDHDPAGVSSVALSFTWRCEVISRVDPAVAARVLAGSSSTTRLSGVDVHYIGPADTARLIRSALRLAFPGVPFAVRSKSYSGGSSVDVAWTDGPAKARVDAALAGFVGKGFDGMIDLAYSSDCYITPAGAVGFARTTGTAGSGGSFPSDSAPVPAGAAIVVFCSYIFTDRRYTRDTALPSGFDAPAWRTLSGRDLDPAPAPKF